MSLAIAVVLLVLSAVMVVVAIDRTSRANAWRRIAEERRWNAEQHRMAGSAGGDHQMIDPGRPVLRTKSMPGDTG
jgi:hypothetical protein